ncbi:MAG: hypothetical protein LBP27_06585 [Treponema sp.]|nr:hypothetical protein [Treponema sp.]
MSREKVPRLYALPLFIHWKKLPVFVILVIMEVVINSRNNGACPLCTSNENCRVQDTLSGAVEDFSGENDPMELVIYSCPRFQEK